MAIIILLTSRKSLLKKLRLILTQLHSSKALRHRLLADKDKRDIGAVDKVLKVTKPAEVLITPYLAKIAPTKRS